MSSKEKVELLAPAGNLEKLEIAIHYGADAVYIGGKDFSLRKHAGNFSESQIEHAVRYARERGVKVFVTCNIFPRNYETALIGDYLERLSEISPDSVIVADPGVFMLAKTRAPNLDVHLSTQANTTNAESAIFWKKLGAKRINLARELSLEEIEKIAGSVPVETEVFVHGAMCISYSGRCLLSSFMAMRDGNRGMCCHPCRWKYTVMEETRPGQYFPIEEDGRGSYLFNSKDLCMIGHIPEMIESGVRSLKIEGRMKGIHYLATTVKVYRQAIDAYYSPNTKYRVEPEWMLELEKVRSRQYCTGFYMGYPMETIADWQMEEGSEKPLFGGLILRNLGGLNALVHVRNKLEKGETVEILSPKGPTRRDKILEIVDDEGIMQSSAQPGSTATITFSSRCLAKDILRRLPKNR